MSTGTPAQREAPVPAPAAALVDLLNSRPYARTPDELDDPESAGRVLRPFGQEGVPGPQRLDLVRAVRTDLVALAGAHDPGEAQRGWAAFSDRVASVTFRQEFSASGHTELRQVTGDPVIGQITRAVAALAEAGTWSRLRLCANDACSEAFYDTTRSRTRRWHSYEVCGNRTNVAAYRARRSGEGRARH